MTNETRDSNGNILKDGDSVTLIKDLKVKGTSETLKRGTLVKKRPRARSWRGLSRPCGRSGAIGDRIPGPLCIRLTAIRGRSSATPGT